MSEKTLYRVSIRQEDKQGHITWHGVLTTEDHEKANETMDMLKGDPEVRVKLEAIIPGKGYEEVIPPARKRR
jgi:late competence protein required for DNA uptake (superfamily II DNA/RNA helicase)